MPSVLYVIGSLAVGGAESQIVLLIKEISRQGLNCNLFALETRGPLCDVLKRYRIRVYDGGYDSTAQLRKRIVSFICAAFRLYRVLRQTQPDILHTYLPLTNFLGAVIGKFAGIHKIITSRRALGTHQDRYAFWKLFDRVSGIFSHRITVNSEAVRQDAIKRDKVDSKKLVLIYNGIDQRRLDVPAKKRSKIRTILGLTDRDTGVVMVGNLIPYKGHEDLLLALSKIVKNRGDVYLFLVGEDRGIRPRLERLARQLNLSKQVCFLGHQDNVPAILMVMDIFVLASHEEGFSNALLEAMVAGLPVVATDVGGNREALKNGDVGILVPSHNPEALAAGLSELLNNSNRRRKLAESAKRRVINHYPLEKMVAAHRHLYTEDPI